MSHFSGIEELGETLRWAKEDQRRLSERLEALAGPPSV
jgi:hypothetical protein